MPYIVYALRQGPVMATVIPAPCRFTKYVSPVGEKTPPANSLLKPIFCASL